MAFVSVYVRFVASGSFKWPLRPGDCLELWSQNHELVGQLDAALLLDLLAAHIRTARLVTALGEALELNALTPERMQLGLPRTESAAPEPKFLTPAPRPSPP